MKCAASILCIGLSVLIVWTECSPVEEVKISAANNVKDLEPAASGKYADEAEVSHENDRGYLKKSEEKGGDGYQHFESFHNKDGDSYGYEKHDAYGEDKKDGGGQKGGHGGGKSSGYTDHEDEGDDDSNKGKGTAEYGPDKHSSYSYSYNSDDDNDDHKKNSDQYTNGEQEDDDEEGHDEDGDGDDGHDDDEAGDDGNKHSSYSYGSDSNEDEDDSYFSPSHYKVDKSRGGDFQKYLSDNFKDNEEEESDDTSDKAHLNTDDGDDEDDDEDDEDENEGGGDGKSKEEPKHGPGPKAAVSYKTNHGSSVQKPVHTYYAHQKSPYKAAAEDHGDGHAKSIRTNGYETHVVHVVHQSKPEVKHEDHQSYTSGAAVPSTKATVSDGAYQVIEHHAHSERAPRQRAKLIIYKSKQPTSGGKKYQNDVGPDYSYGQQFIYASDADFDATY